MRTNDTICGGERGKKKAVCRLLKKRGGGERSLDGPV